MEKEEQKKRKQKKRKKSARLITKWDFNTGDQKKKKNRQETGLKIRRLLENHATIDRYALRRLRTENTTCCPASTGRPSKPSSQQSGCTVQRGPFRSQPCNPPWVSACSGRRRCGRWSARRWSGQARRACSWGGWWRGTAPGSRWTCRFLPGPPAPRGSEPPDRRSAATPVAPTRRVRVNCQTMVQHQGQLSDHGTASGSTVRPWYSIRVNCQTTVQHQGKLSDHSTASGSTVRPWYIYTASGSTVRPRYSIRVNCQTTVQHQGQLSDHGTASGSTIRPNPSNTDSVSTPLPHPPNPTHLYTHCHLPAPSNLIHLSLSLSLSHTHTNTHTQGQGQLTAPQQQVKVNCQPPRAVNIQAHMDPFTHTVNINYYPPPPPPPTLYLLFLIITMVIMRMAPLMLMLMVMRIKLIMMMVTFFYSIALS